MSGEESLADVMDNVEPLPTSMISQSTDEYLGSLEESEYPREDLPSQLCAAAGETDTPPGDGVRCDEVGATSSGGEPDHLSTSEVRSREESAADVGECVASCKVLNSTDSISIGETVFVPTSEVRPDDEVNAAAEEIEPLSTWDMVSADECPADPCETEPLSTGEEGNTKPLSTDIGQSAGGMESLSADEVIAAGGTVSTKENTLPVYTWDEVAKHNHEQSLWLVISGNVYDVTNFMPEVRSLK